MVRGDSVQINGMSQTWFYKPELSKSREQLEVKCVDSTHLFTRMRRKICHGGIEGLTNESWLKVAKQGKTLLTSLMIQEITDPMSVSMARTQFSEAVEIEMRKNGDSYAADLCRDVRLWWESEDVPGLSATTRLEMRDPLRRRLLSKVNFKRFPPATQYIGGWPLQLWEGIIANIDAKAQLCTLVHGGTYNVRAFSSLIGETFFSEITMNDKGGHGTVTAKKFGELMGYCTEQLQIRLDQRRTFAYCTSKTPVYDAVDESEQNSDCKDCLFCSNGPTKVLTHVHTRDHAFDKPERKRLAGRRKCEFVSKDRNAVMKGTLGVRWDKARLNYSKILPTKLMGIDTE